MKALTLLAAPVLLAAPSIAQMEPAKPHESLARFDAVLGHWEGTGSFASPMSTVRMPWTCTSELESILDGFGVREVLDVDMGEMMGHYRMVAVYAYDANRSMLTKTSGDNWGGVSQSVVQWVDNTLVSAHGDLFPQIDGSTLIGAERAMWAFDGDTSTLDFTMCSGVTAAYSHVAGTLKRTSAKPKAIAASMKSEELAEPMQPLAALIGDWHMKGSMTLMAGMPAMEISGDDHAWALVGGQVIMAEVLGGESEEMGGFRYKALGFLGWNAGKKCWDHYALTNMGDVMLSEWRSIGEDKIVMTHSGQYMGQPYAERGVYEFGDAGPKSVWSDRYSGAGEGVRVFQGTYEKKK